MLYVDPVLPLILCVGAAYGYAVVVGSVLRASPWVGAVITTGVALAVLLFPLLIPADKVVLRALAALACTELMLKMLDYARQGRRDGVPLPLARYWRFLLPFPVFLVVFHQRKRRFESSVSLGDLFRVVCGAAGAAMGFLLLDVIAGITSFPWCFALDHAAKLVIFVITIESLSQLFYGLERLTGYDTLPPMRAVFLSQTVAEFWFRYNHRVHVWLDYNVFRPAGGRKAPIRGVLLTFLLSALFHEVGFAIATSRMDGYQFTFFMLQAPAVLLSPRLRRFAKQHGFIGKIMAHSLTIAWFYVTSMFFFHGVNRIFPFFYVGEPWLP